MSLIVDHVTRSFGATRAVDDVSLSIEPGQIVGLIGENGAGKTTLMRIAAGELRPDTGRIVRPDGVGIVHQHFALVSHFTIAENLALVRDRRFRFVSRARLEHEARETIAATEVDLPHVSRLAADLSVGERAKLELIKAVASHPDLLILDEPTTAIDPLGVVEILDLLRRLVDERGLAILLSSHLLSQVQSVCDRIGIFAAGRLVGQGTLGELAETFGDGSALIEVGLDAHDPEAIERTKRILLHVKGVRKVSAPTDDSGLWRVTVRPPEIEADVRREILSVAVAEGLGLTALRPIVPSLDEIYRVAVKRSEIVRRPE